MTLPNAYKGVKKIFIAEILQIIGAVFILAAVGSAYAARGAYMANGLAANSAVEGLAMGGLLALLGGALLPLIGFILNLVGLKQASKDEPSYMNKAFWCTIVAVVLTLVGSLLRDHGLGVWGTLSNVCEMCAIIFTILGISEVTQNIARQDVADMGPKILTIAVIAFVVAIIAAIVGNVIGGVAAIVALVALLVAYVVFLVFLARATSALAKG